MLRTYQPVQEWVWSNGAEQRTCTVHEREHHPRFSGLLDQHGNRLVAIDRPEPIGFVVFDRREDAT